MEPSPPCLSLGPVSDASTKHRHASRGGASGERDRIGDGSALSSSTSCADRKRPAERLGEKKVEGSV
jgi:hypothetical protein